MRSRVSVSLTEAFDVADVDLPYESSDGDADIMGANLGDGVDAGRLEVAVVEHSNGVGFPVVTAPDSDAAARRMLRSSRVNQFLRRLVRRLGHLAFKESMQPVLMLLARKLAQCVWQRRVGEASVHADLSDARTVAQEAEEQMARLRSRMDELAVRVCHVASRAVVTASRVLQRCVAYCVLRVRGCVCVCVCVCVWVWVWVYAFA
jgi:hypothetical protein